MERKQQIEQEQHCINIKMMCDYIKTEILMIDNFHKTDKYLKILDNLKKDINEKYWEI